VATDYASLAGVKARLDIDDTTDDPLLNKLRGQVNAWMDGYLECPVGPSAATSLTLDGHAARQGGRMLFVRQGVRTLTKVEVGPSTGEDLEELPAGDWLLRPLEHERDPEWPAQQVWLTDVPTGSWSCFPPGYSNVKLTGTFGFAAIPADLVEIGEITTVRAFKAKKSGQRDMSGNDEQGGQPLVSRWIAKRDLLTLHRYRSALRSRAG
jgi:hypothetical protein